MSHQVGFKFLVGDVVRFKYVVNAQAYGGGVVIEVQQIGTTSIVVLALKIRETRVAAYRVELIGRNHYSRLHALRDSAFWRPCVPF